ncbi:MAG TPA: hypothetical protein VFB62_02580 [Polyangiaceae bacterium]|nr:hypothetical protein [Polyangiaceae bacterium]
MNLEQVETMNGEAEPKDQALYIRISQADIDRLDAVVQEYPLLSRSSLLRIAVRIGLDAIEGDPSGATLMRAAKSKAPSKAVRKRGRKR